MRHRAHNDSPNHSCQPTPGSRLGSATAPSPRHGCTHRSPSIMRLWLTATASLVSVALVSCAQANKSPTCAMLIRSIGPLGERFYSPAQPIWRFAITNTGTSEACWMAGIQVQGGSDMDYSHAGGHVEWPDGVLAPGYGIETNMIVPARTGSVWRAHIDFWAVSPRDLKKAVHPASLLLE
jgi:hypothetical protein